MVSPAVTAKISRREHARRDRARPRTTSRLKLALHFSPAWVFPWVVGLFSITAVLTFFLQLYLLLLLVGLASNAIMALTYYDVKRTGDYWYVPFNAHPEHRPRG